jgi:putative N6-adenine-specific DNA methylase
VKNRKNSPSDNEQDSTQLLTITLKTFYGLEDVLADELVELGYPVTAKLNRAIQTEGQWKDVYFLNLHLRCAISVLVQVAQFTIREEDDLYKKALKVNWPSFFDVKRTIAVRGAVFSDFFKHSQFPFLVVKDAIADRFRNEIDERPDVNLKAPQIVIDLYINRNQVTLSLNTSGLPLFQRGYRESAGDAPLNEVVAAGLIRLSGWDKRSPFVDPFCGSGTLLIEAALMAAEIPALIERQHFAFKNFNHFDAEAWEGMLADARKRITSLPCQISGSDISEEMVLKARRNLRRLAIGRFVETSVRSFDEVKASEVKGIIVTNPPYGERLSADIEELYAGIGSWLKHEMVGFQCWLISSSEQGFKSIGLKPDKKMKLYNGDLECSFRKFSVYEGSKKRVEEA